MTVRRLLDLCCGAGGASVGYHRAGWEVVGVDMHPQPNYPFEFHQGDALTYPLENFDLVHASPPCQGYSSHVTSRSSKWVPTKGRDEPMLIDLLRARFEYAEVGYVIENVVGAAPHMRQPTLLCGTMFGLPIARHRLFESNFILDAPIHAPHRGVAKRYAEENGWEYRDMSVTGKGRHAGTSVRWRTLLGVDWDTTQAELSEMIPPAYTEFIGNLPRFEFK